MRHRMLSDSTVWLSVPTERDVDAITQACRHSSIGEWTTIPVPYIRVDALMFVETTVPKGWADDNPTWALRSTEDGPALGIVSLNERLGDDRAREIGFWLSPMARGRGLMTRAVRIVCNFAFASHGMQLERVEWRAFVGNRASAAVVARAGFRYEGILRGAGAQRGRRRDEWVAARLRSDPATPVADWPHDLQIAGPSRSSASVMR